MLNLNGVVSDVEQLLRRSLGEHVELRTSLSPGLWSVLADPGQLEQVLLNLAVNARDAMPGGGTLSIETDNLHVDDDYASGRHGLKAGRYVRLRISDTGTGMPRDVLERVFEPFFTTKPKGEGTGLGLTTVYGIITQAEGHAQIYSEPGLGTTFTVLLPATDQRAKPAEAPRPRRRVRGGETVLVVEDEDAMREVTRRILARNGYQVLTAASGEDAITMVTESDQDIELLITDVVMPRLLGRQVAEQISAIRPSIRVLYMSGYAQPVLASQGTLDPGVILIEKPFTEADLLDRVRNGRGAGSDPHPRRLRRSPHRTARPAIPHPTIAGRGSPGPTGGAAGHPPGPARSQVRHIRVSRRVVGTKVFSALPLPARSAHDR